LAHCFITRQLPGPALDRLAQQHNLDVWPEPLPPPQHELLVHTQRAEGLISLPTDRIDAELISRAPKLKVISNYAVGYDNVDLSAAAARGIPVGHTPGALTDATADLTFALLLAAARQLPQATASIAAGKWRTWDPAGHLGVELAGTTLGIVGYGRIGQAVAARAAGFGMQIIHTDSRSGQPAIHDLLAQADFVSLHCPLTDRTRQLINADALGRMKSTAILVNTARGPIVDHDALARALHQHEIAGAALDVTDPEPIPVEHPLLKAPNLLLTPHIGSATTAARSKMAELAVDNLLAGLAGQPLPHQVPAP
jgi:glyoxylate reductase